MAQFLAIDTAAAHLTVLAQGKVAALKFIKNCALRQSVALMGEVESALGEAELTPGGCDFFCAVTGPGSFTGIRIGISAAKGFALATGKPLMPLTSFELIAYNVDCEDFFAVVNAAHGHSYACRFTGGVAGEPQYVADAVLEESGLKLFGFEERTLKNYTELNAGECLLPAVLKKLESDRPFGGMHALYVRKSQAEEGRK